MTDLSALTPLELATLRALVEYGTIDAAAREMGENQATFRSRLWRAVQRTGSRSLPQLMFLLGQEECRRAA